MPVIQVEDDKAERLIAQVLRDEHHMMPAAAIVLASKIIRRLRFPLSLKI